MFGKITVIALLMVGSVAALETVEPDELQVTIRETLEPVYYTDLSIIESTVSEVETELAPIMVEVDATLALLSDPDAVEQRICETRADSEVVDRPGGQTYECMVEPTTTILEESSALLAEDEETPTTVASAQVSPIGIIEPVTVAAAVAVAGFSVALLLKKIIAGALFSRILPHRLLEHPKRQEIVDIVEQNPGIHQQELMRRSNLGVGSLLHHTKKLESAALLHRRKVHGYACYFSATHTDYKAVRQYSGANSDGARAVLEVIRETPGRSVTAIATAIGVSASTVSYHVRRFEDAGAVEMRQHGRERAIYLAC